MPATRVRSWTTGILCLVLLPASVELAQAECPTQPVPATQEIVVLDPNADPTGKPAVQLVTNPMTGCQEVNIPPVVIVHRFYYTGDRCFQGPMLPGGPSVIVVQHPATGERCYVPVQMLPGAPVVRYCARSIEYDYGANGVTLSFGVCGAPSVSYRCHTPLMRAAGESVASVAHGADTLLEKSHLPEITHAACAGTKNFAGHVCEGVGCVGKQLTAPAIGLARATPIGSMFTQSADEVQRRRDDEVRLAGQQAKEDSADIPTLR